MEVDYRGSQLLIDGKVVATDEGASSQGTIQLEVKCTLGNAAVGGLHYVDLLPMQPRARQSV